MKDSDEIFDRCIDSLFLIDKGVFINNPINISFCLNMVVAQKKPELA